MIAPRREIPSVADLVAELRRCYAEQRDAVANMQDETRSPSFRQGARLGLADWVGEECEILALIAAADVNAAGCMNE
jgi:hypothetical protein